MRFGGRKEEMDHQILVMRRRWAGKTKTKNRTKKQNKKITKARNNKKIVTPKATASNDDVVYQNTKTKHKRDRKPRATIQKIQKILVTIPVENVVVKRKQKTKK